MKGSIILLCVLGCVGNSFSQKEKTPQQTLAQGDSAFNAGNFSRAIPLYESALKDPKIGGEVQPWYRLGASYHNLRDHKHALAAYTRAEKINPGFPFLRISMARSFSAAGDVANATARVDSALRQGFGNYKLLEQHPEFENLRKSNGFKALKEKAYANSHPCSNQPAAHAFDFWLGEWDVYPTSNPSVVAGFNRITSQSGGCVLLESWESQGPHNGVSINYFDPVRGKWQQKWAGSAQDIIEFYDGEFKDGAMQFKWDGVNPDGSKYPGLLTFTNLEPGKKVRQHSQRSNDGGATWVDVYDFTYIRRK